MMQEIRVVLLAQGMWVSMLDRQCVTAVKVL